MTSRRNNTPNPISSFPTEYIIGGLEIVCPNISALHFPGETVVYYNLPFILKRFQLPLRLAFATTINNAQGQTFAKVGLLRNASTPVKLKIGAIVMLLRNFNPRQSLFNHTHMVIQRMCSNVFEAQILTETKVGHTILVPKISLATSDTYLPFILKRHHFPLRLAFAMTINKTIGQNFAKRACVYPWTALCFFFHVFELWIAYM
ncbi:hypothetical protein LAZ67_8000934 [Cordylochernes scorpioides]|uniref:DNA helicase Pif1-like 2B domain-containing protein n=1 Tax=Cordylochernes scorpioides TaxID=51811 RepID=A0ABY6KT10_9ARAC|nr:hypothetical protein LAZ67_8000934 [Cordylochernes scorpioides]